MDRKDVTLVAGGIGLAMATMLGAAIVKERATTFATLPARVTVVEDRSRGNTTDLDEAADAIQKLTTTIVAQDVERQADLLARRRFLDAEKLRRATAAREAVTKDRETMKRLLEVMEARP